MLRVAFVLRSTEVHPVFLDLFALALCVFGVCFALWRSVCSLLDFDLCSVTSVRACLILLINLGVLLTLLRHLVYKYFEFSCYPHPGRWERGEGRGGARVCARGAYSPADCLFLRLLMKRRARHPPWPFVTLLLCFFVSSFLCSYAF